MLVTFVGIGDHGNGITGRSRGVVSIGLRPTSWIRRRETCSSSGSMRRTIPMSRSWKESAAQETAAGRRTSSVTASSIRSASAPGRTARLEQGRYGVIENYTRVSV